MFNDEQQLRRSVGRLQAATPQVDPRRPTATGSKSWKDWGRPRLRTLASRVEEVQERLYELGEHGVPLELSEDVSRGLEELLARALELAETPGRPGRRVPEWQVLAVAACVEHWPGELPAGPLQFANKAGALEPAEPFCEALCALLADFGLGPAQVRTAYNDHVLPGRLPPDELERYAATWSSDAD